MQQVTLYSSSCYQSGIRLAFDHHRPQRPRACLLFCHGVLEHRQRYQPMLRYLAEQGIESVIMDQPGHGETGPLLGHLPCSLQRIAQWQSELFALYANPELPCFIAGHSMGTLVATRVAALALQPWQALLLCSSPTPNRWQGVTGSLLHPLCWLAGTWRHPRLHALAFAAFDRPFVGQGVNAWLSSDPQAVQAANQDPLIAPLASLSTLQQLAANVAEVFQPSFLAQLPPKLPVALFYGDADPVGSMGQGPLLLAQRLAALQHPVDQFAYHQARHELMHERQRSVFFADLNHYLQTQLTSW